MNPIDKFVAWVVVLSIVLQGVAGIVRAFVVYPTIWVFSPLWIGALAIVGVMIFAVIVFNL